VFSTVGFGDITANSEAARLVVTGQMIADLVIIGIAVKVIVGAVKGRRKRQPREAGDSYRPSGFTPARAALRGAELRATARCRLPAGPRARIRSPLQDDAKPAGWAGF